MNTSVGFASGPSHEMSLDIAAVNVAIRRAGIAEKIHGFGAAQSSRQPQLHLVRSPHLTG